MTGAEHVDPIASVVLHCAIVLVAAKLGGEIAVRLRQPAVLGELLAGVVMGNLVWFDRIAADPAIDLLARLGVLILLFEVGLESTVKQMLQVGLAAFLVAVVGVVAPFALGWGVGALLVPELGPYVHAFLGATLSATSVGITARVLKDLGAAQRDEARIILGAAVIDDVLGLVVLAVVSGAIVAAGQGSSLSVADVGLILGKATLFLVGSLALGVVLAPHLFHLASRLRARGVLLAVGVSVCFLFSWLASAIGLAAIVGAFAAGLILEDVHTRDFARRGEHGLEDLLEPISSLLVPFFFVLMGMRTDLAAFADPEVLGLAGALTAAAILGKQACSLAVWGRPVDRLSIGIGMIPRGEVGLIFANIGLTLTLGGRPVISPALYSAVVVMVIVTTIVTPPALTWSLARSARRAGDQSVQGPSQ
ncbi:MAG TPA: cation:proton antiporter [Kofleriaceae bacterium]|jgi:Kef-type K+ transport system membrane component KefB